jgi:DhnA family fructose-bisphosphate aldolase class Ia
MAEAHKAGAIGFSVGRNMFENSEPEAITRAMVSIFREKTEVQAPGSHLVVSSDGA